MAIFLNASNSGCTYWALDVPLNFSPPPLGTELTVMLMSSHPDTVITGGDIVFCFAHGRLVMALQVDLMASMPSLQVVMVPTEDPSKERNYLTAVRTHVAVREVRAPYTPGHEALIEQLHIAIAACMGPDDNVFSAICEFDQQTGKALHAAILQDSTRSSATQMSGQLVAIDSHLATDRSLDARSTPDFLAKRHNGSILWAVSVPHNFSPPRCGETVTVITSSVRPADVIAYDDVILFFSRSRLVMVARAKAMHTPVDLQISVELKNDPDSLRGYLTTVEAMVTNPYAEFLHRDGDKRLRKDIQRQLGSMFSPGSLFFGDAKPYYLPTKELLDPFLEFNGF